MAPQNRKLVLPITLIGKVYRPKEPQEVALPNPLETRRIKVI